MEEEEEEEEEDDNNTPLLNQEDSDLATLWNSMEEAEEPEDGADDAAEQ